MKVSGVGVEGGLGEGGRRHGGGFKGDFRVDLGVVWA